MISESKVIPLKGNKKKIESLKKVGWYYEGKIKSQFDGKYYAKLRRAINVIRLN